MKIQAFERCYAAAPFSFTKIKLEEESNN